MQPSFLGSHAGEHANLKYVSKVSDASVAMVQSQMDYKKRKLGKLGFN